MKAIDQLKKKRGIVDDLPNQNEPTQEELDRLEQERKYLEEEISQEEKKHRVEVRQWEKKVKEAQERLGGLSTELKAKEQENRLSKLKIREMQRLQKHN